MLDYVLFAVSGILALIILLIFYLLAKSSSTESSPVTLGAQSPSKALSIPNWDRQPNDPELGDLGLLSQHGSLHQYLLFLHDHGRRPIVMFWWGKERVVSVCSPEMFKDFMKLTYRPKLLFMLIEPLITSLSIQYANGLDWEERRKFLYPTLRDEFLESYIPCFVKIANETADNWSKLSPETEIDIQEVFFLMTIKGITRTCFGNVFNDDGEINRMSNSYHMMWNEMEQRLHIGPPEPGSQRDKNFHDCLDFVKSKILQIVRDRNDGVGDDEIPFVDALLKSRVSDDQIFADCLSFMVGGFHTSGYLLVWSVYYLSSHPDVFAKLLDEMKDRVGANQTHKLKDYVYSTDTYLRQVLDETLRFSTLAPYAARYSDHDTVIGGYSVPAGTPIIQALGVALKNECTWENVDVFDPDHCAPKCLQGKDSLKFAPFGTGRRKCPGYMFSYVEVGVFLTILLQRFSLKPVGGAKQVKMVHGLVTSPSEPIKFHVNPI